MGFDEGRIVLDSVNGAYYPGQTVYGRLEFDVDSLKSFRGIYADFKGYCKVHWTTEHTRRENERDVSYTVTHESYEEYFDRKVYLVGDKSGKNHLQPGHHSLPFQFQLPENCPSSFEGSNGHIRYRIKVVVDRAFKIDQEKLASIRVIAPLDLNAFSISKNPIEMEIENTFCCWCMSSGMAQTLVKLPAAGYCSGQTMPIEVSCTNNSNVEVERIRFLLRKEITYRATTEPDSRKDSEVVAEISKGPIPGGNTRNYTLEMKVPTMDVLNLKGCQFISVYYEFKVIVVVSGCHTNEEATHRIIIGDIPLRGFQDDWQNPLIDQMPKQTAENVHVAPGIQSAYPPPSIPNQGLPTVSPYPIENSNIPVNSPYPGGNPPYPGGNPPYPGGNPPYPGGNPPYPGGNPPYPGGNPPYPGGNPPYPGGNSPYPGGNPPYPGGNPPYPGGNPPYPGGNPPYHGGNPPYPGGNPPYPANSSVNLPTSTQPPYPVPNPAPVTNFGANPNLPFTGMTSLKTGNFGFVIQGNAASDTTKPILPTTAANPFSSNPSSQFASATAPAPSAPQL